MRTRWIRRLLWLAGFGCLWLNVLDDPPLRTGPYVQNVGEAGATIAKIAALPAAFDLTVHGDDGGEVARVASASKRRHALRVDGLRPDTRYSFVLEREDGRRETGSFRTAPATDDAEVRFAFFGDSGDQPWWVWLQRTPILHFPARWQWFPTKSAVTGVGAAVAEWRPDFALHLGDVIYPKGLHAHYSSGFFRPFAELIRNAPVYAVPGNHDVMNAAGQQLLANFHGPANAITGDARCFSFARGAVRIIGLDCNTHYTGDRYQPGHPTYRFLMAELARCTEPWIVVASHFPMKSASRQRDRGDLLLSMLPELERWQVSLYLAGHDHCYQRFGPNEKLPVPLVVSGGGGKRLYDVRPDPRAAALAKAHHWCAVTVRGRELRIRARDLDGGELDDFALRLPDGQALERLRALNPGRAARISGL